MAKHGIGLEVLPYCENAQKALLEAKERYDKTGKMGLSGPGIKTIKELWEYHDLQRTSVARSEYERMIKKTANNIRSHNKDVVEVVWFQNLPITAAKSTLKTWLRYVASIVEQMDLHKPPIQTS